MSVKRKNLGLKNPNNRLGETDIPFSMLKGKASYQFDTVLSFHVPVGSRILDVTAGSRISWQHVYEPEKYNIVWADIKAGKIDDAFIGEPFTNMVFADVHRPYVGHKEWFQSFDAVYYDPPYFFGVERSNDPRKEKYGGYAGTYEDLQEYMQALVHIKSVLKPGGVILLKCADQYVPREKKLHLHHLAWIEFLRFNGFDIIDFYVGEYSRSSGIAFQVLNRQSSVIKHTYYIVGRRMN